MLAGTADQRGRQMADAKRRGLKPGVSDICIAHPAGRYHGAYLEVKRDKKSPVAAEQSAWLQRMQIAGYYAGLAVGYDSLVEHTRNFLAG